MGNKSQHSDFRNITFINPFSLSSLHVLPPENGQPGQPMASLWPAWPWRQPMPEWPMANKWPNMASLWPEIVLSWQLNYGQPDGPSLWPAYGQPEKK